MHNYLLWEEGIKIKFFISYSTERSTSFNDGNLFAISALFVIYFIRSVVSIYKDTVAGLNKGNYTLILYTKRTEKHRDELTNVV